jgi:hypothetical protein
MIVNLDIPMNLMIKNNIGLTMNKSCNVLSIAPRELPIIYVLPTAHCLSPIDSL